MLSGWRISGSDATVVTENPSGTVIRAAASAGGNPWPNTEGDAAIKPARTANRREYQDTGMAVPKT